MKTLAPSPTDSDPDERRPAGPLYVPVRTGSAGGQQLRFMRTPLGARTAVGFTTPDRLTAVMGEGQPWIRLAAPALLALTEPLGVHTLTVDPHMTAPPAKTPPASAARGAGRAPWHAVTAVRTYLN
ncbi:SAV_915 family protein [Streptomyces sp. NPDC050504]|uniref:SAV_915 family protein n=1 Tax=Streptomyces sp. NPDC050504 TaxID=3365618 RepID=UPI00379AED45